jgi:NAD(P)-dependent dehydrogenase (short-subunit alcohol dehydrogenase family)
MSDAAKTASPAKAQQQQQQQQPSPASAGAKAGDPTKAAPPSAEDAAAQQQQPGVEAVMSTAPVVIHEDYKGSGKMAGMVAFVTGGDSGIGRSVLVHFAREGADCAFLYGSGREDDDARDTEAAIKAEGRKCLVFKGDAADPAAVGDALAKTIHQLGRLDVVVGNAGEQHQRASEWPDIDLDSVRQTIETNAFGYLLLAQAACKAGAFKHGGGGSLIFTSSVTAFAGSGSLIDYSGTKGFEVALTRSLAKKLAPDGVRVNCVAPGPVWTPLIAATFDAKQMEEWGKAPLLGRAAQPCEIAPAYVLLASRDGSFMTGATLHINGGQHMA